MPCNSADEDDGYVRSGISHRGICNDGASRKQRTVNDSVGRNSELAVVRLLKKKVV